MHELGFARNLLEAALATAHRERAGRILAVSVQIGELAGVVPDALRFAFTTVQAGTAAGQARLDIEWIPAAFVCQDCGGPFDRTQARCSACRGSSARLARGRELQMVAVELE